MKYTPKFAKFEDYIAHLIREIGKTKNAHKLEDILTNELKETKKLIRYVEKIEREYWSD